MHMCDISVKSRILNIGLIQNRHITLYILYLQFNIFEGYAVFDIQEKKKATDKSIEKAKEPSTAESEEKSYEQQTLFPSTNMY